MLVIQLCGSLCVIVSTLDWVISVTRGLRFKGYLVSMGSMFILLIRVICTRVITGLICFMFIERMLT